MWGVRKGEAREGSGGRCGAKGRLGYVSMRDRAMSTTRGARCCCVVDVDVSVIVDVDKSNPWLLLSGGLAAWLLG